MPNPNVGLGVSFVVDNGCGYTESEFCASNPGGTYQFAGTNRTTYTCPDGYNINSNYTLCTRAAGTTTSGSDAGGKYTITYESCAPDRDIEYCVRPYTCSMNEDCSQCL